MVPGKQSPLNALNHCIETVNRPPQRVLIRTRQIRLIGPRPTHPAAPVPVSRWFRAWLFIQRARGDNDSLAVTGRVRDRAIAAGADLPREASRFRQIKTRDEILSLCPAKLSRIHCDIG